MPTRALALLSASCAAVAVVASSPTPARAADIDTDVLVLGAGWAGAAAASFLLNQSNGSLQVVMLEAAGRVGGRVQPVVFGSSDVDQVLVERGANWIQGMRPDCKRHGGVGNTTHNPLWDMACATGLNGSLIPGSEQEVRGLPVVVNNGTLLTNSTSTWLAQRQRGTMKAYDCAMDLAPAANSTAASVLAALRHCGWVDRDIVDVALRWKAVDSDFAVPADAASLLLSSLDETYSKFGPNDWLVADQNPHGFSKFVHDLVAPLATSWPGKFELQLDTNVTHIDYSDPSAVVVHTANGTRITARYVVVTFSAGVLRHDHAALFTPPLSKVQAGAVESVPMANFTKIFLQFPQVWWPNQFKCTLLATNCADVGEENSMFPWHNLAHVDLLPGSNTLFTVVTGALAGELDRLSDDELQTLVMQRLRCSYPAIHIPDPVAFYTTRWTLDPLTRGAYSVQTVAESLQTTGCAFQPLAGSVRNGLRVSSGDIPPQPRVLFAGEAACQAFPGYTHGSYLSGILAAHDVLASPEVRAAAGQHLPGFQGDVALEQLLRTAELCRPQPCATSL